MTISELYNLEARREAREMASGSGGKFDSPFTALLYNVEMNGFSDETSDHGDGAGATRIGRHIVWHDSQGFVSSDRAATVGHAEAYMAKRVARRKSGVGGHERCQ